MSLHRVASLAQIPPGMALLVRVDAREIGLFNDGGTLKAIKNLCPHYGDALHKGKVVNGKVVCPGHAWHFDLTTGACTSGPADARVRTFPVVVHGDDVFVEI